ncbi:cobyric acid synthase [Brevibacillus dissolubilis]|uniref:cobyric acid synthase n=1 Tax=Brevibacillus dissolubilis TaxID=1844116 RepID=UPI001115D5E3|nr:cobyric acid synthase [Brevibacillus dissolubilis]
MTPSSQARALMIQGTASDVGKSLICTALCRMFANKGVRVAPFKSQNMALNSYVTQDGGEIGRAQGVQAEACRVVATTDMNPILLKPKQDMVAEIIVHGRRHADLDAKEYRETYVKEALPIAHEALLRLQNEYDLLILEGAGSPAEVNLRDRDIANMRMAHLADASVILVADIERGGVFASIIGTLELLPEDERQRIKGFIINKFRGRRDLLDDGVQWLEERTGIPVLAVLPYMNVDIEAEDSLALSALRLKRPRQGEFAIDIAVIRLPRISNFTDFDPLFDEPDAGVRYVSNARELGQPDLIIIPGTKNTVEDYLWLQQTGLDQAILCHHEKGKRVIGICGGYQMLGTHLYDPHAVEGTGGEYAGLGLLPVETVFNPTKRTVQIAGRLYQPSFLTPADQDFEAPTPTESTLTGYEIHLGVSTLDRTQAKPFVLLEDGREDGAISADGRVLGTYLHGIFHNRHLTRQLTNQIRVEKGLQPLSDEVVPESVRREEAYNMLARHVEEHLDMDKLYQILGMPTASAVINR